MLAKGDADEYVWLEGSKQSPRVSAWLNAQAKKLEAFRSGSGYQTIYDELNGSAHPRCYPVVKEVAGAIYWRTASYLNKKINGVSSRILDTDAIECSYDEQARICDWHISPSGKYVALTVSIAGHEEQTLMVYNLRTGKRCNEGTLPLSLRISCIVWRGDEGFFYRWAGANSASMRDLKIYWHKLGTGFKQDTLVSNLPHLCGEVSFSLFGEWMVVTSASLSVDKYYAVAFNIETKEVRVLADGLTSRVRAWIIDGVAYILTSEGRKGYCLVSSPFKSRMPSLKKWRVVVSGEGSTLVGIFFVSCGIIALYQKEFNDHLKLFDFNGRHQSDVEIPDTCRVEAVQGDYKTSNFWFFACGFSIASRRYCYNAKNKTLIVDDLGEGDLSTDEYIFARYNVSKPDGTIVPLAVMCHRSVRLGQNNPVLLSGYGGFHEPVGFRELRFFKPLLDRGVVIACALLRGDGGNGEKCATEGIGAANKPNTFSDFLAAARFLRKHCASDRIAAMGASNGALTVAASLVIEPELFRCASIHGAILDMRRILNITAVFGGYKTHYGDPSDPLQWRLMQRWCPYFNLRSGVKYPPVLISQSPDDQRVGPAHGWKFAAKLQGYGNDCLLSARPGAGHNKNYSDLALEMAYIAHNLRVAV